MAARPELPSGGLLEALQNFLRHHPPVQGGEGEAEAHFQHATHVAKSLNVSPQYATHFRSGIRELVQNWRDQCKVVAAGGVLQVWDLTPPRSAAGDFLLAFTANGSCCGYMAMSSEAGGGSTCNVWLCNYASSIGIAAMTLGESNKRGDDSLAGFFGEVRRSKAGAGGGVGRGGALRIYRLQRVTGMACTPSTSLLT